MPFLFAPHRQLINCSLLIWMCYNLNATMRSCKVTLISSSAEMPWMQAATMPVDVCRIKGCIEMAKSKALPAIGISLFSKSSEGLLCNTTNLASCLHYRAHEEKNIYGHLFDVTKDRQGLLSVPVCSTTLFKCASHYLCKIIFSSFNGAIEVFIPEISIHRTH